MLHFWKRALGKVEKEQILGAAGRWRRPIIAAYSSHLGLASQ